MVPILRGCLRGVLVVVARRGTLGHWRGSPDTRTAMEQGSAAVRALSACATTEYDDVAVRWRVSKQFGVSHISLHESKQPGVNTWQARLPVCMAYSVGWPGEEEEVILDMSKLHDHLGVYGLAFIPKTKRLVLCHNKGILVFDETGGIAANLDAGDPQGERYRYWVDRSTITVSPAVGLVDTVLQFFSSSGANASSVPSCSFESFRGGTFATVLKMGEDNDCSDKWLVFFNGVEGILLDLDTLEVVARCLYRNARGIQHKGAHTSWQMTLGPVALDVQGITYLC